VQRSTTIYMQLQCKHEPSCEWYFHVGEMTMTLQDVVMQINLSINETSITGLTTFNKYDLCLRLFVGCLPLRDIKRILLG